ncbi:MAG: hypothetical protein VYA74_04300 [Bacteroidota bacterium]|mgnify:FL=1|nr:hypothetical protein [Bacteroidota bacterium]
MQDSIIKSILKINPNAQVSVSANDVKQIDWHDGTKPIAEKDILAKEKELLSEYDANKYQRDRVKAYPSIEEQLDDLYHNGIDGWKKTIKAIKDKYPKG